MGLEKRNENGDPIVISDLDDTLIRGNSLIRKTYDYLQTLEGALFIVTGRSTSDEDATRKTLEDLGVRFSSLMMNPDTSIDSTKYKRSVAVNLLKTYNVIEAVENDLDTLLAYRSLGIKATDPADLDEMRAPAPAKDQIVGSDKNKPDSAKGAGGDIKLDEATEVSLRNKVTAHNEDMASKNKPDWSRATFGQLAAVYRRGAGAFSVSHRPGMTRGQWAMGRVNAYLYLLRNGRPENAGYVTDNDLLPEDHPRSTRSLEELEPRAINQEAPAYMRAAARRGLDFYKQGLAGDGVVERTIREARLMADGQVSDDKWVRISAWIARHLVDLDSPNANPSSENYPSAGVVAHLLWGSGPSKAAARRVQDYADSVVARIKAQEEGERMTDQTRALPDELAVGDYVAWLVGTEAYAGEVVELMEDSAEVAIYEEEDNVWVEQGQTILVPIADLNKVDPLVAALEEAVDEEEPMTMPMRTKWLNAAYAIKAKIEGVSDEGRAKNPNETRTAEVSFELRESGDGMTFEGYAAVFNSDSSPLPFIERIAPGAFERSLKSRNDIKLLWNHDTSLVLGSTRAGTLRLVEDSVGLKAIASLPETQAGRDASILLKRGDVSAMSFGFTVPQGGDTWDKSGNVRTLNRVSLHEVSLVAFPAYGATAGTTSVRSVEGGIDADTLADALLKLELGEELEAEQAILVTDVVSKLTKTPEVQEVEGDILALKKKKLDLLMLGI